MEIGVRKDHGRTIVAVAGELDVFTSARLRAVLFDPVLCAGPSVLVDLEDVTFIDSTSIGVLVAARRWLTSRSIEVGLVCEGQVRRVLDVVGLDKVFTIHPSVEDAVG